MSPILVAGLVVVVAALAVLLLYNRLVTLRNRIDASWADIDVHLRRRHDLIPNLVEAVSAYAVHERGVFEAVAQARTEAQRPHDPAGQADVEADVDRSLRGLFGVAEAYPELKADARFRDLQLELAATENKIAFSRQLYNDSVTAYATAIESFPVNLLAGPLGFGRRALFAAADAERVGVSVDLDPGEGS